MPGGTLPDLHVGVALWAHRVWLGSFLPVGTRQGEELAAYSRRLNAVEGNTTFYASPPPSTVARWLAATPTGFEFTFKLPREITHERRLRPVEAPVRRFLDLLEPLRERVGAIAVQLPASFGPTDLGALAAFVATLPASWRWCVEVRHPGLFSGSAADALDRVLGRADVERVTFDTTVLFTDPPTSAAERSAWERKPRVPARSRALTDRPVVRYIGRDDPARTEQGWQRWVPVVSRWLAEGREPTFFVHTPDDRASPLLAQRFHAQVADVTPGLARLPEHDATAIASGSSRPGTRQPSLF